MITALFLIVLLFCIQTGPVQEKADLTVLVEGIRNDRGRVLVALFNAPAGFPESGKTAYRSARLPAGRLPLKVVFRDIDQGTYAVCFVHDVNGNERLDRFMGIPSEQYGVSNNISMGTGPPKFEEAQFSITGRDTVIRIRPAN